MRGARSGRGSWPSLALAAGLLVLASLLVYGIWRLATGARLLYNLLIALLSLSAFSLLGYRALRRKLRLGARRRRPAS